MDLDNLENRIAEEYHWLHAWIALHPYAAALAFFLIGLGIGKLI